MLMPGAASLFYGDEQEITGVTEAEYRSGMNWAVNGAQCGFIRKLAEIRKIYTDGKTEYMPRWSVISDGMFVFDRKNKNGTLTAAVNAGDARKLQVPDTGILLLESGYENHTLKEDGYVIWHCP